MVMFRSERNGRVVVDLGSRQSGDRVAEMLDAVNGDGASPSALDPNLEILRFLSLTVDGKWQGAENSGGRSHLLSNRLSRGIPNGF